MRAVTNRRKQEYPLDQGSRKARGDGEIYQVQGRSDLWVKILNDHSREKQLEIEKRLTGGGSGEESPMEIVYYRGRFTGYTFRKLPEVEPKREAEPPQAARERIITPARARVKSFFMMLFFILVFLQYI